MRLMPYSALLVLAAACSSGDNAETGTTGGAADTGIGGAAGTGSTMTDTMMADTTRRDSMMPGTSGTGAGTGATGTTTPR